MIKPSRIALIIVMVLAMSLGGCLGEKTVSKPGPNTIRLYGKVHNLDGQPLPNSYVQVSDQNYVKLKSARTNKNGEYAFLLPRYNSYNIWVGAYSNIAKSIFKYIPETRTLTPSESPELEADFTLNPGANIFINAYDETGNLIPYDRFISITDSKIFVTELSHEACSESPCVIKDKYSNWDWNYSTPAVIVTPATPTRIRVQWEIPGFGKVMISLDNEGKGYEVDEQSGVLIINLNYEAAKSKLAALQKDHALFGGQGYEISSTVDGYMELSQNSLEAASNYLKNGRSSEMKEAVHQLDLSLRYASVAHEQLYLNKADADIEKYRKGTAKIDIVDTGNTQPDTYTIQIKQLSSDFHFGANPMGPAGGYDKRYVAAMKDMGINYANITPRWGFIEPEKGVFDWENIDGYQNIWGLTDAGFNLTGSLSLWLYCGSQVGYDFCPLYQYDMTFEELKQNMYNHMYALANRYKGKIDIWEINEMNLPYADALNLSVEQKLDVCDVFAKAVKAANPEAKILVSSISPPYDLNISQVENPEDKLNYVPFPSFLDMLIQKQIPVDIIGLEFYYSGVNVEGHPSVSLDLVAMSDIFDQYLSFNKPIVVSEFSAPSVQVSNSAWWHSTWDEQIQTEYAQKFYGIAFSKPMVQGITWSWGVCDKDAFIIGGGLLNDNLQPKIAYYSLMSSLRSWSSTRATFTVGRGEFEFSGYSGDYEITAEDKDGRHQQTRIHITGQETEKVTINFNESI
jgi:endo-1,4-beta-xylanase